MVEAICNKLPDRLIAWIKGKMVGIDEKKKVALVTHKIPLLFVVMMMNLQVALIANATRKLSCK